MSNFSSIFYEGKDCDGSCDKKDKKEVQKESGLFGYDLV